VKAVATSTITGYVVAVALPVSLTMLVLALELPAFVFEHLVVLLVVAFAIPWGLGTATTAAVVAVSADNVLLRDPVGQPAITGVRDALDLFLFIAVAVIVSGLVTRARRERMRAEDAAERERRAREERDRLIATVTHDLGTPLAVLAGTLQFARRAGSNADLDLPRLLGRLETATGRAASLVRMLADVQAIDSASLALNRTLVDLREIVAPIVEMLDRVSDSHPVVLAMPARPLTIDGDPERLKRVVENLINNAIKYSPAGGAVEVTLGSEDGHAVVQVRDYGIGISSDARSRVFERSYRAPEALVTAPGLGLGLSIAAEIVARHGGAIEARPAEPCGTVMTMRLPSHVPDPRADAIGRASHV
jgi:signal transduction histidine kinase